MRQQNMGMTAFLLIFSAAVIFCSGCLPADQTASSAEVVEHTWELVDTRYALFMDKPEAAAAWDAARSSALEKVASDDSEEALFQALDAMLATLEDGHVNLVSPFDVTWDTARYRETPGQYDEDLMERQILDYQFERAQSLRYAMLPESNIAYLRILDFEDIPGATARDHVFASFQGADGLIIDIRENGGGSLDAMLALTGHLIEDDLDAFRVEVKSGPAHDALTEPEARIASPTSGDRFTGPVAILMDRQTYSAANTFAHVLDRRGEDVLTVGTRSGGGGGIPFWFELPNGWNLRISTSRITTPDGAPMEDGLEPDLEVTLDPEDVQQGRDTLLEAAIDALE